MASKAVAGAVMTVAQYYELGEDPPMTRLELSEGRLIVAPSSNYLHNQIRRALEERLGAFVRAHKLGVVTGETDVRLGGATVRRPDVAFFRPERLHGLNPEDLPLPAPDLAFEVLSRHDRKRDVQLKTQQYLEAGVTAVWLLDPKTGQALRCTAGAGPEAMEALEEPELLPGLRLQLSEIFAPGRESWG